MNEEVVKETNNLTVQFVTSIAGTPLVEYYEAFNAKIVDNRELQSPDSERSTRHIEIVLPDGVSYSEGDHIGVLPHNRKGMVERVLRRFRLNGNDHLILSAAGRSAAHLPLGRPVSLFELLTHSVELQESASRAQLRELASYTVCPPHKRELEALLEEDTYKADVQKKRVTMLDLLERYEACEMPFERFLELLPPLKARYYSISSSPRVRSEQASITVGVVRGPAWSGTGEYRGVASNYLAECQQGDSIDIFIRTPESNFQLPESAATPIIMVGPGTGVAPFRGFLQARRAMQAEGQQLGPAHLYFGCRNELDYIYRDELAQYVRDGVVTLHTAISRKEGEPKTYVQHLMERDAKQLIEMLDQGGHLYICGDGSRMAPDVEATLKRAYENVHDVNEQESAAWLERLQDEGRLAKDVWAGI